MGVKAKGIPRGCQVNTVNSASLGYPLSVFNKTLLSNVQYMIFTPGPAKPLEASLGIQVVGTLTQRGFSA